MQDNIVLHIKIKGLPKRTNNRGSSWRANMAEARKWKEAVYMAALQAGWSGPVLSKARLTLIRHSSSEPDFDGLVSSFKHPVDGLIKVGVITDDKPSVIGAPTYQWRKCQRNNGYIEIVVENPEDKVA